MESKEVTKGEAYAKKFEVKHGNRLEKIEIMKAEMKKQAVAHMWFSSRYNRELIQANCNLTDPTTNRYIAVLVGAGFIVENEHGRGFYNLTESING